MSKLTHVRKALEDNPSITIVGAPERNYLPGRDGYWSHTIDFHVAPKTGGVYTAKELQELMISLIPGLEPTRRDDFREWDREMEFGKVYFDEDIGTEAVRHEIVLIDEDMFSSGGFVDGKRIIERTEKVERRTWVRLFPNAQIAAAALEGENKYRIPKSELTKHRGIVARLANAFA
ncbi:MAG: hypothetical protein Q8R26_02990 [bacterium]|nr:hypothetical protein [bacterium]